MRPDTLLALLIGAALAVGGYLHGRQTKTIPSNADGTAQEVARLRTEVEILKRENESLRSLAQGGGELAVPTALVEFAEKALGLEFRSSPVVHRIAGEELRERVAASVESLFPPNGLDHRQQAWVLMGLLTPDDRFAPQLAATRSLGARSWFDPVTGEGWVTDRFDDQSIPDQGALLRALVRILIHQNFPPPPGYPGDEPARAREALHHGTAIVVENRFLARQALGLGFAGTQADDSGVADLLASLPPYIQGLATFPSRLGTPRAGRLMDQEEILLALHQPPVITASFFPDYEAADPAIPPLQLAENGNVLTESCGMLGLQLWLQTLDPELAPLALAWRNDQYQLTARNDTHLDLQWAIQVDSEESATKLLDSFLAMAGALAQSGDDPSLDETLTAPDGRRLSVNRSQAVIHFRNLAPR